MPNLSGTPIIALTRRQAIWLYAAFSMLFVAVLHVASDTALISQWARLSLVVVLSTFSVVGVIMFGRKNAATDFFFSTAIISLWTLLVFAAVYFNSPICLYAAMVPFLIQIVIDCLANRGGAGKTFIIIWSLWFSTGVVFSLLIHGPFDDVALVAKLSSIAWYIDIRVVPTLVLCVFVLFHSLLSAQEAPTRRLIREIDIKIEPPEGNGLFPEIIRGIVNALNDLLLQPISQFINIITGFISAMLCYMAAIGREIGQFVQRHVLNFTLIRIMLRRIGIFSLVLFLSIAIPSLANGTLEYVRTTKFIAHIGTPLLDILIALCAIALIQLLLPIEIDDYIQRAARAGFFLVCVVFSARTIAIGLSYIPNSPLRYARNLDCLYLCMVVGIVIVSFAGIRGKPQQS